MMAISHADHDHPNTPAARAKCRKNMGTTHQTTENVEGDRKPAKLTVVPRRKGDGGVVKGMTAAKPNKPEGRLIKNIGDLPDVPRMLAYGARLAWSVDWEVRVGTPFNDTESRIVVKGTLAEIALVWRSSNPNGIWAVFVRNWNSSKTFRIDNVQLAFEVAMTPEAWDEHGNYIA